MCTTLPAWGQAPICQFYAFLTFFQILHFLQLTSASPSAVWPFWQGSRTNMLFSKGPLPETKYLYFKWLGNSVTGLNIKLLQRGLLSIWIGLVPNWGKYRKAAAKYDKFGKAPWSMGVEPREWAQRDQRLQKTDKHKPPQKSLPKRTKHRKVGQMWVVVHLMCPDFRFLYIRLSGYLLASPIADGRELASTILW